MTTDPRDQWEQKIEKLSAPIKFELQLTPSQKVRLDRIADDKGLSLQELVQLTVVDLLDSNVGAPVINAPSFAKQGPKVTGYTGSVTRG